MIEIDEGDVASTSARSTTVVPPVGVAHDQAISVGAERPHQDAAVGERDEWAM